MELKKNSEVRIPCGKQATGVRMQSVEDSDPPLIEDHQIENLVGVLNPMIHPPVGQNTQLNSDS